MTTESIGLRIRDAFADAGARGWLHARPVPQTSDAREVAVDADEMIPLASVYKLPLLIAFAQAVDAKQLDPRARTTLAPKDRMGGSSVGIASMLDPVTISWRDLAASMITVSDNAAAEALYRKIGPDTIAASMSSLGLANTVVHGTAHDELRSLARTTKARTAEAALQTLASNDARAQLRYNVLSRSFSTPRDLTALLDALWTGRAASQRQCRFARGLLTTSAGPNRLRSGFPFDDVIVASKSGTFGALRHDVGVIVYPGESPVAVAVMTEAARSDRLLPEVDAVIGRAARLAVGHIRGAR
jgi:beta-lactamase class A